MAGAVLRFENGYLGFERVVNPENGEQYLRAVIHSTSTGRTTSSPVELSEVFSFASEAVKQALLADGHSEVEIGDVRWNSNLPQ